MDTKHKLRLGVFVYVFILLFTPGEYTLYSICVDGMASVVSVCITAYFISFLNSRKPTEKNILNKQMVMNFCLKFIYYLFYFMAMVVGYIVKIRPPTDLEKILMSSFLSYSTGRLLTILSVATYTLMSASRTLLFILPRTYHTLNVKLFQRLSMAIISSLALMELILSQLVFSSDKCDVNENGYELHTLTNFFPADKKPLTNTLCCKTNETDKILPNFNETWEEYDEITNHSLYDMFPLLNQTKEKKTIAIKTCTLFPTLRIIMIMLVLIEMARLITAIARMIRKMKNQTVQDKPKKQIVQVEPHQCRVQPKPDEPKPKLKRSESFPIQSTSNLSFQRRGSHEHAICFREKETKISIPVNVFEIEEITKKSKNLDWKKLKNYVSLLVLKTYSLVIITVIVYLCSFFLPVQFYFFWQLKFQYIVVKLDLFLAPVVWIIIDKEVWNFTSRKIKEKFLAFKMKCNL